MMLFFTEKPEDKLTSFSITHRLYLQRANHRANVEQGTVFMLIP